MTDQDIDNIAEAVVAKLTTKKIFPTNIYNPTTHKETFGYLSLPDQQRSQSTTLARMWRKLVG